jgi:hypothetical protein
MGIGPRGSRVRASWLALSILVLRGNNVSVVPAKAGAHNHESALKRSL